MALQDRRLYTVLLAILQQPQNDWHIEQLSDLSAQCLIADFVYVFCYVDLVCLSVVFYTQVRLQSAAFLLKQSICACIALEVEIIKSRKRIL